MLTVQGPVVHVPPDQPENNESDSGVAVSRTSLPPMYSAEQSGLQLIPAGILVTVPVPEPALLIDSVFLVVKIACIE
jgi:hypothetical protein